MKKTFISIGLAAVGAAGIQSIDAQTSVQPTGTPTMDTGISPKTWNVAANLRGFYDDNYAVAHNKTGSFGIELTPSISANVAMQQTDVGAKYTFGMYYYQQRQDSGIDALDYTHQGDLWLDHSFNERQKLTIADSLVIGQDPQLVQGGAVIRVNGDNLNNTATVTLNSEWTRLFSTATHYGNTLVDYNNSAASATNSPSYAALLNRIQQDVGIDFQWAFQPETIGFIGYDFTWLDYTGNAQIAAPFPVGPGKFVNYYSDSRNYYTHYAYLGLTKTFSPNLSGSFRVGASLTDLYNDPVSKENTVSPYANINVTYTYLPGCYVQLGFTQNQNVTDISAVGSNGQLTQYQESSSVYLDLNHQITSKLSGSLVGSYQHSTFQDGQYNNISENTVSAGIHFDYRINRHFSANAGYDFSELLSTVNQRGNSRNVVYLGLGANY